MLRYIRSVVHELPGSNRVWLVYVSRQASQLYGSTNFNKIWQSDMPRYSDLLSKKLRFYKLNMVTNCQLEIKQIIYQNHFHRL